MILKLNTTNFICLDPDLLAQEGHSPTDVVKEHHRRNCFPCAPDPEQLCSAHQELPVSPLQMGSPSPPPDVKPDQDVTEQASIPVGELSGQPTKLHSYPFKFHEIIEWAKQFTQCGAALDPFPNQAWFIDEKSTQYITEGIAECKEKGVFIPPGKSCIRWSWTN